MRKWISLVLASVLFVSVMLVWFREPLLIKVGWWLLVESPDQKSDLIVALGGGRRRQVEAARLLHQGLARWILFLGPDVRLQDYYNLDIPVDRIALPATPAHTTYDEAMTTRAIVRAYGFKSVLIVTSPYHERRSLWVFTRVFQNTSVNLQITSSPDPAFSPETWWRSYNGCKSVVREYMGLAYYWLTVR